MFHFLAFHVPFMDQSLLLALFGLLIFGKRLPEVGKSLGKGIVEFKRGLKGIEDEVEEASSVPASQYRPAQASLPPASPQSTYKFDPHTGQPIQPAVPAAKFDPYTGKPIEAVIEPDVHATV